MKIKALLLVGLLAAVTCAAMAYSNRPMALLPAPMPLPNANGGLTAPPGAVTLDGKLTQNKIHAAGDRTFDVALTMAAGETQPVDSLDKKPVDMVIVLDRSGSMGGQKIRDAQKAVLGLMESLSARDRFALVTYANDVTGAETLECMTPENRSRLRRSVEAVCANGGTNLGAGLQQGIALLASSADKGRMAKVILISDGQANQGVTDPGQLAAMAGPRREMEYSVTTVGIGQDFNEQLMATVADGGRGRYYYLREPGEFLAVFTREADLTRNVAASSVQVHVPLDSGVEVVSASGYPVAVRGGEAVISPGDLLSGQTRTLYITLRAPQNAKETFSVGRLYASFTQNGKRAAAVCPQSFDVEVTDNAMAALGSIDADAWEKKVVNADYNALREEVAHDIKEGKKEQALGRIASYMDNVQMDNSVVGSSAVQENLDVQCEALRQTVESTFTGDAPAVAQKQKAVSKDMQYEGYKNRRGIR